MNSKTFSKFFVNTFLFGIVLLCLVGIASTNVNAQKFTIKKDFCGSIGNNNTCNGKFTFGDGTTAGTVDFTIEQVIVIRNTAGGVETVTPVPGTTQTVVVVIDDNSNSSGTSDQITLAANTDFIVCEVTPSGFTSLPRPSQSTGGSNQSTPPGRSNCILFNSGSSNGNFDLKFLNIKAQQAPTAATATVSGRIRDINGKPAARVAITIANIATGEVLSTRTDLFGRYSFTELPTGEDYLLRVFSRRHAFGVNEILINLLEDLTDANFTTGSGRMSIAGQ
jgi:hypothetical protein